MLAACEKRFSAQQQNFTNREIDEMTDPIIALAALIIGGVIGFVFGAFQNAALAKNEKLSEQGKLRTGWSVMPGSMSRVAVLLVVLVVIQVFCPLFFRGNIQWMVSAGVLLGYGSSFVRRLRHRTEGRV